MGIATNEKCVSSLHPHEVLLLLMMTMMMMTSRVNILLLLPRHRDLDQTSNDWHSFGLGFRAVSFSGCRPYTGCVRGIATKFLFSYEALHSTPQSKALLHTRMDLRNSYFSGRYSFVLEEIVVVQTFADSEQ